MKFKGKCLDYIPEICDTKLVYCCWKLNDKNSRGEIKAKREFTCKHKEYACPLIDYTPDKENEDEED